MYPQVYFHLLCILKKEKRNPTCAYDSVGGSRWAQGVHCNSVRTGWRQSSKLITNWFHKFIQHLFGKWKTFRMFYGANSMKHVKHKNLLSRMKSCLAKIDYQSEYCTFTIAVAGTPFISFLAKIFAQQNYVMVYKVHAGNTRVNLYSKCTGFFRCITQRKGPTCKSLRPI